MLSDTSRRATISSSMRASMPLRLSDRRSSSSPEPSSGMRLERSPVMIVRLASVIGLDAAQHAAADGEAGADAEDRQQRDAPQPELTHGAGEAMQVLDVAADDQHETARDRQGHADGKARDGAAAVPAPCARS